jgi:ribonucleoside-diphosphate reductase alpha chain
MYPQIDGKSGWQGCNLTEINGGMCSDEVTFQRACKAASILGTLQAGYTNFKFLDETSKRIFDREALLGVSITGWMNNPRTLFDEKILEAGATTVRSTNRAVAALIGINPAARTTCVKPSGNASVLLMTASGIHADHSPMYIRNIQLNKDTEVARLIKKLNPHMVEESVWSAGRTDYVISFPVVPKKGSLYKDDTIGIKHLELIAKAQKHWVNAGTDEKLCADKGIRHNVSNTVIVDDWDEVAEYVYENRSNFAGISFLAMTGDKDYAQAPNTKVIDAKEIVKTYGTGSVFASGLVVDGLKAFDNLWVACMTAQNRDIDISSDDSNFLLKKDWIRRFKKFAENYFKGDAKQAEYCLKDVFLLHKWEKIQQNLVDDVDWENSLVEKKYIDVDTMGAAACVGTADGCLV